jgi:hypothetical protein
MRTLIILVLALLFISCDKEKPVDPPPPPSSPPIIDGYWDVEGISPWWVMTGLLNVSEDSGVVTGSLGFSIKDPNHLMPGWDGTVRNLSGTLSNSILNLGGHDSECRFVISNGLFNREGTKCTATLEVWDCNPLPEYYVEKFAMLATKQ